jgi:hypothetical protein
VNIEKNTEIEIPDSGTLSLKYAELLLCLA